MPVEADVQALLLLAGEWHSSSHSRTLPTVSADPAPSGDGRWGVRLACDQREFGWELDSSLWVPRDSAPTAGSGAPSHGVGRPFECLHVRATWVVRHVSSERGKLSRYGSVVLVRCDPRQQEIPVDELRPRLE